ncbi:MAG: hypothetical protein K6T83_19110 [Alicyclobacillus sp.]|nr:hypothetical protein [Alicyclobacillus sp.]
MWEFMNGMTDGIRSRMMPRRRNGMGTMTAMLIGASVGIAAWEAMRRNQWMPRQLGNNPADIAEKVMENLQE